MTDPVYEPGQLITTGVLYRRIFPHKNYFDLQAGRPTRQVFDRGKNEHLSMAITFKTSPSEVLRGHDDYGLCEIDAEVLIAEGLEVRYAPSEQEGDAHVAIIGPLGQGVRHRLARRARVIVAPRIA